MPLFSLSRLLSSYWVSRTGSASDWCALQEAQYKCIDTIQYIYTLHNIYNRGAWWLSGRFGALRPTLTATLGPLEWASSSPAVACSALATNPDTVSML